MPLAITLVSQEANVRVVELVTETIGALQPSAERMALEAGLADMCIEVRLTDRIVAEVQAARAEHLPTFATKRMGGDAVARASRPKSIDEPHRILVNAGVFESSDNWLLAHLPQVLAHEVAHCLVTQSRIESGLPSGYVELPVNPVQMLGYTALTAIDEYVADRIGNLLLPPVSATILGDDGDLSATDRLIVGINRLTATQDALDESVHPYLPDLVRAYRATAQGFDELVDALSQAIYEGLTMSAHYRAAIVELPRVDVLDQEIAKVAAHPGTRLYFDPFWDEVAPLLDPRFEGSPLVGAAALDQRAFDAGTRGLVRTWAAMGISFEELDDDDVFVHVSDPLECD